MGGESVTTLPPWPPAEPLSKAGAKHISTISGYMTDDTEPGHIETPICGHSIEKHADESDKVFEGVILTDNVDKK